MKDSVLLDTCRKLELVSDVVFRKLDHILTMRNEVAASHPNVERIGGFELLGWLQTCMKDVLQDRPSDSAIQIRAFVDNLKNRTDAIDAPTASRLGDELKNLALPHLHNLLITLFGMFVAPDSSQTLRLNISKIAPAVWQHASDQVKLNVGLKIDAYRTNLDQARLVRGQEFLRLVDGLSYESIPTKIVALDALADQLRLANAGYNNFYNEPQYMTEILRYCGGQHGIPKESLQKLVRTVLRCRLGRGLSYCEGVSPGGKPLYDRFFGLLDDDGIAHCLAALFDPTINSKLSSEICQKHLGAVLSLLRTVAISERLKAAIDLLLRDVSHAYRASGVKEFRELTSPFIRWN